MLTRHNSKICDSKCRLTNSTAKEFDYASNVLKICEVIEHVTILFTSGELFVQDEREHAYDIHQHVAQKTGRTDQNMWPKFHLFMERAMYSF